MLVIPIAALVFVGGSFFLANRFLPPNVASKAMPWMAATAFVSYFITQVVATIFAALLGLRLADAPVPIIVGFSLLGSLGGAWIVLSGFVRRHRRHKTEKAEKAAEAKLF